MAGLVAAMRTVGIGDGLPVAHQPLELLEGHLAGVLQEDVDDIAHLLANARVAVGTGQLVALGHAQQAACQRFGHIGERLRQPSGARSGTRLAIGPPAERPTPALHAGMLVVSKHLAAVDLADQLGQLGLDVAPLLLEHLEPVDETSRVELGDGSVPDRFECHRRCHVPMIANGSDTVRQR